MATMRRKELDNQWRCILTDYEYEKLWTNAPDYKTELAIRLGGEVGLRAQEIADVQGGDIHASMDPELDAYFLRVRGKDTTGEHEDGKHRDAYVPDEVERLFTRYTRREDIGKDEDVFDVTKRTIQRWIKQTAETTAEETGVDDFRDVSAHDLRATFATQCLVEEGMNPRVVMSIGGWSDYDSIKPYLAEPTENAIVSEFQEAGLQ